MLIWFVLTILSAFVFSSAVPRTATDAAGVFFRGTVTNPGAVSDRVQRVIIFDNFYTIYELIQTGTVTI